MKRRDFTAWMVAAALWPAAARAQKKARIGVLVVADPEPFLREFRAGLRSLGYVEGRNLELEVRSGKGKAQLLPQLAADLVRRKVDVLVAWQTPAAQAAKQATRDIPIVISAGDPVGTGLVASLARPGGNITGMGGTTAAAAAKTLELVRELLPSAKRMAVLANAHDPFTRVFLEQLDAAGRKTHFEIRAIRIKSAEEFDDAFAQIAAWPADAVVVQPSLQRQAPVQLALKYRLPSVSATRAFPEAGGLMSFAGSIRELYGGAARYADRILKGARPADLPVGEVDTFELVINLRTAKTLGITVPRALLLRADHVIE